MSRTRKPAQSTSPAAQAGASDGEIAALLPNPRDYSDDFIRRRELTEADRQDYKAAWYAAFHRTQATFQI